MGELVEEVEYEWVLVELPRGAKGCALVAASGTSPDKSEAKREASHYARQYEQDGPVEIELYEVTRRRIE